MQELVSVVIPIYNAELYLEETILSVINQTYRHLEIILVNHNSTDGSTIIMNNYQKKDPRISIITLDINKGGPAYPRNEGLKAARGEYIAFLDSDDVWLETKIEMQVTYLQETKSDIVYTLAYEIDANSKLLGSFNNQKVYNILQYLVHKKNIIYYTNFININSVLMKIDKNLLFDENRSLVAVEDWKFWIDCFYVDKKIRLFPKKMLKYRIVVNSASQRGSDIGYRKTLYLLSKLFLERKVVLHHYMLSSFLNIMKIIIKNFKA